MAKAIREARERLSMTQEALAALLGVAVRTVRRWESGETVRIPAAVSILLAKMEEEDGQEQAHP